MLQVWSPDALLQYERLCWLTGCRVKGLAGIAPADLPGPCPQVQQVQACAPPYALSQAMEGGPSIYVQPNPETTLTR